MKKTRLFKIIALALMTCVVSVHAMSQNQKYQFPGGGVPNDSTIVRGLNMYDEIIYDKHTNSFYYYERSNPYVKQAVLTSTIVVNDFEIINDEVCFCGHDANNRPVFGVFDITSTFVFSAPINCYHILPLHYMTVDVDNIIQLDKIEAINIRDTTHYYMIGAVAHNHDSYTARCMVDVYNNVSFWVCRIAYEHDNNYQFDDLAATDDRLVVIGRKAGRSGPYTHEYMYPTYGGSVLSTTPIACHDIYSNANYGLMSDVLIEHIVDTIVASAYIGIDITGTYKIVVNITYGASIPVSTCSLNLASSASSIKEIRYNPIDSCLYILTTPSTNVMYQVKLDATYHPILEYVHNIGLYPLNSLDFKHGVAGAVACGTIPLYNNNFVWFSSTASNACNTVSSNSISASIPKCSLPFNIDMYLNGGELLLSAIDVRIVNLQNTLLCD